MSQLYINNDADAIFICGDLNARCGNGIDTLLDDSDIPERHVMDTCTVNLYGEKLIDFVRDMTLCIVNGRVSPEKDNYTSISNRGRSVVDYILTQQHFLSNCNDFAVHTVTDLIEQFNLQHYVSSSSKPPDHSVLWINLSLPGYSQRVDEPVRRDQPPDHLSQNYTDNINIRHFTKFMYNGDKHEFMNNNSWLSKTQEILDHIKILETQCDVDKMYDNLCTHIFSGLDIFYKKIDSRRSVRRRHKHSKPYWDDELGHLWKCMREKEKCYLKCTGSNRAKLNLHKEFKLSRYNFDKSLRQKERIYNRNKIAEIDHFKGNNPTEFWKAIKGLKNNKACGIDGIPNYVLKEPAFLTLLWAIVAKCFEQGVVPSIWRQAVITPIPKGRDKDIFTPLNYRGISLLSTVSKVYSSILNSRLSEYLETCGVLCEEQNGFRKGRSCEDHAFVLTNLIQDRIDQRKSTYVSFIDFEKAFDWINRDLLLYKLIMNGIDGKFYFAIKSLYC